MFYWYLMKVIWVIEFDCFKNIRKRHPKRFHCIAIEIKSWKQYTKRGRETITTGVTKTTKCTVNRARNNYLESIQKYLSAASNSYFIIGFLLYFRPIIYVSFLVVVTSSWLKGSFLVTTNFSFHTFVTGGQI